MRVKRQLEQGATALIVVVFSVLLLLTVSVSFMRLVIQDQNRGTDSELSRGAYDSALAGVEDGKRVLQECVNDGAGSAACRALAANKCTTVSDAGIVTTTGGVNNEVLLKRSSSGSTGYDQAYTCVTIDPMSPDYIGNIAADKSTLIPLRPDRQFKSITVSWYHKADALGPVSFRSNTLLSPLASWTPMGDQTPPLIRAQLIQHKTQGFKLEDFDGPGGGRTLYLFPTANGRMSASFTDDSRPTVSTSNTNLIPVRCSGANFYVCSITLQLPVPVDPQSSTDGTSAYLRLTSLYGGTDFKINLSDGAQFDWVQPSIDSTGRASNVFRRVKVRTEYVNAVGADMYPRATIDITKNLCKDFSVTDQSYIAPTCNFAQP